MFKTHGAQQLPQKLHPALGIVLVKLLVQPTNVETSADEFRRDLESVRAGFSLLKRASIGGDCGVKVLGDLAIEGQALTLN